MRPFLYPIIVVVAFAGVLIVVGNIRTTEQVDVCPRCGRVRTSCYVQVFGSPFEKRVDVQETEFTRRVPGALECTEDNQWASIDRYRWRAGAGYRSMRMSETLERVLSDPTPYLRLAKVDPTAAQGFLRALVLEGNARGNYYNGRGFYMKQRSGDGATERLEEALREKEMTPDEYRAWKKESVEPSEDGDDTKPRRLR